MAAIETILIHTLAAIHRLLMAGVRLVDTPLIWLVRRHQERSIEAEIKN